MSIMKLLTDHAGRAIRLSEERLAHILRHREMAGMESALAETVANAEVGRAVRQRLNGEVVLPAVSTTHVGEKWLCVVVKDLRGDAFIITGYLTDSVKKGTVLWPSAT